MEQELLTVSVSQLNHYIKRVIEHNGYLKNICIQGEISNFKHHPSGHLYITLKDETSTLRAVMFRTAAQSLRFIPEDGMKVAATGRISVYEPGGTYQLYIESLTPDGEGALYQAFLRLKEKLEKDGLFDPTHKKSIPLFPDVVSVVTAASGAAVRDIIHVLKRRYPLAAVKLFPVPVQGEGAARSIAEAIRFLNEKNIGDVIIAGRGGGSIEDLWAFNEEVVARAIYDSKIPVISAVGHETDFTIADFVADLRAPTPSAAAELAVPNVQDLQNTVRSLYAKAQNRIEYRLFAAQNELTKLAGSAAFYNFPGSISDLRITVDRLQKQSQDALYDIMNQRAQRLGLAASKLQTLSPLSNFTRGYAYPAKTDGTHIKSVTQLEAGEAFSLKLADGLVDCIAKTIYQNEIDQ
ncbi:MAG: exodeoxyribonuclease VII large subunit [Ruminococcaceae bacterium]|nr:exodeoxyribonuclease VII large subunit [Oscillospiraceae bacterium]